MLWTSIYVLPGFRAACPPWAPELLGLPGLRGEYFYLSRVGQCGLIFFRAEIFNFEFCAEIFIFWCIAQKYWSGIVTKNGKMWELFLSRGPPPSPLFGNDMFVRKKWFILHFRTLGTFIVGGSHSNSKKWKWDSGRPPPVFFLQNFHIFPVFFGRRP